ncbi:hypothetical protein I858_003475 [Planococcus versutus]|uniref:Uncharacterized protein n=1 Tax=Planococcus versutus TaxID=1302659 RepID=A0A1B1RYT0_9BACL|nr:hypothetical protein I858_003475 [Planococcus versutus]
MHFGSPSLLWRLIDFKVDTGFTIWALLKLQINLGKEFLMYQGLSVFSLLLSIPISPSIKINSH